jgi:hypothetical protein
MRPKRQSRPKAAFNLNPLNVNQAAIIAGFDLRRYPSIEIDTQATGGSTFTFGNCTIVGNLTDN